MNYRDTWDLSTIPDDKLTSEYGRRRSAKRALKDVPPEQRAKLDKVAERMRKWRAKGKK